MKRFVCGCDLFRILFKKTNQASLGITGQQDQRIGLKHERRI